VIGLALLALLVVVTLGGSADQGARYDALVGAGTRSADWLVWAVAVAAAVGVPAVEPVVRRRWYRDHGLTQVTVGVEGDPPAR
jgi:hypothetical protein